MRQGWIGSLEVIDDRLYRCIKAVQVEAVEAGRRLRSALIEVVQPTDKGRDLPVPPHPGWETPEVGKRLFSVPVVALVLHKSVDPEGVRPVGFHRDEIESQVPDQPLCDLRPLPVKLASPVRRLADQDNPCSPHRVNERVFSGCSPL